MARIGWRTGGSALARAGAAVAVVGALIGLAVPFVALQPRWVLLGGLALVLISPLIYRGLCRRFDIFEPFVIGNVALFVMFVVRPIALLVYGNMIHWGYDVLPYFDKTLMIALVGATAFQFGYFSPWGITVARAMPSQPPMLNVRRSLIYAWVIFFLGLLLYGLFLLQSGGLVTFFSMLAGRDSSQNFIYLQSTGYLYYGLLLLVPASLILLASGFVTRRTPLIVWGVAMMGVVALVEGSLGNRINLLPLVTAPVLVRYLVKRRRPAALKVIISFFLVGIVGLGFLRDARTAVTVEQQSRLAALVNAVTHPGQQVQALFLGADTEMFDSLSHEVQLVPSVVPYQHGAILTDVLIRAVPRPFWPDKPLESNDLIVSTLWPEHYAVSRAAPAFSILGQLFVDSGLITVGIGMFFIGLLLAAVWQYRALHSSALCVQIAYSMFLPYTVILFRGTIQDTLSRILFTVVPLLLLIGVAKARARTLVNVDMETM